MEAAVTTLYISRLALLRNMKRHHLQFSAETKKTRTQSPPMIKENRTDQAPGRHIGAVGQLEACCPTVHMATGQYSSGHFGRDPSPEGYKGHCTVWTPLGKIREAPRRNSQRENG